MKTYFTSREIDHQWAHQLAPRGKCPSSESFEGKSFYSYSTEIGRIIERKGRKAYLLNVTSYSVTTSGHQNGLRGAIPANETIFRIGDCGRGVSLDIKPGVLFDYSIQEAAKSADIAKQAKADWKKNSHHAAQASWLKQAAEVSAFFGLRRKVDDKSVARLADRIEADRKRQAKLDKERQIRIERENADTVKAWLAGESVHFPYSINAVYLRFASGGIGGAKFNSMETSKGVTVPLGDAKKAFRFVMLKRATGWHRNGDTFAIGEFQLDAVNEFGVIAGCHRIEWKEIERFAATQNWI